MSKVEIEIPDDRWFRGEWQIRPQDKQLCVVIPNVENENPIICQWRWGAHNHVGVDAFCDVSERFHHESMGIIEEEFRPDYLGMGNVDRWKPLGLPEDVNGRILAKIEKWFMEDEKI